MNNVEEFDPRKGKVHKATDDELLETANANTFPMTFMMRFLGPQMLARAKSPSQRSAIINMTAYQTHGQSNYKMPVYASCKSMQDHMSRIFGLEVEDQNMDVLTVR